MKKLLALLLVVCFAFALCACGAEPESPSRISVSKSASGDNGWYLDGTTESETYYSKSSEDGEPIPDSGEVSELLTTVEVSDVSRKVIKRVYLELETKEYDKALGTIKTKADSFGGYVSDMNERRSGNSRYISLTVRIPAEFLDDYTNAVGENCNILSNRLTSEDITDSYYNVKGRMDGLIEQEARLSALIEKADTLDYLIKLEKALSEVRGQINELNYQLQIYDKSVTYSYVNISLYEVIEYQDVEEPTFWQKIGRAFTGGFDTFGSVLKGVVIAVTWALPFLAVAAVIVVIILIGEKKKKAKKASKKDDEN